MDRSEAMKMIDAISTGREYTYRNDWRSEMVMDENGILFHAEYDHTFDVTNPAKVREIAGALVLWANRKEGTVMTADEMAALTKFFGWVDWAEKPF